MEERQSGKSAAEALGANVRALMEERGYSRTQLAEILGVSVRQVDAILRGCLPKRLTIAQLDRLCRAADVTLAALFAP